MDHLINLIFGIPTVLAQTTNAAAKSAGSAFDVLGFVLENLPLWITAIIVLIVSAILGVILKNMVESKIASRITSEHQEFLIISGRLTFVAVIVVGGMISLAVAGINITNLIAAIGFGISFGMQDTISNFVAGIGILASQPFSIGDWIKVNGKMGKVTDIRVRATYLNTYNGLRLIVPNAELYKSQVLSYTSNPLRRMKVPVYTRYCIDMKQVFAICMNVAKSHTDIMLSPKPNIILIDLADYYVYLELRFWVDSKGYWRRIQSKVFMEIQRQLEQAGLDSPWPTTSLTFDTDDDEVFVKTQSLGPEDLNRIMKMRKDEETELSKNRDELIKPIAIAEEQRPLEQGGASFLKVTTMPMPNVAQQPAPAFPPNTPQAAQSAQQATQQTLEQMKPSAFAQPSNNSQQPSKPLPEEPVNNQPTMQDGNTESQSGPENQNNQQNPPAQPNQQ